MLSSYTNNISPAKRTTVREYLNLAAKSEYIKLWRLAYLSFVKELQFANSPWKIALIDETRLVIETVYVRVVHFSSHNLASLDTENFKQKFLTPWLK